MLGRRKLVTKKETEVLENIKRDIKIQLRENGIIVSGMNMQINSENISLSIFINSNKRLA